MANSKFEYVKSFEQPDFLLPNTWIVVRVDGRGFTKLCAKYNLEKPNDKRALDLMNAAARVVVTELPDITVAYGVSDEYSFVFHKSCTLFERRASKIVSTVVSTFTANYVHLWSTYFTNTPLSPPLPSFDGRAVCYPTVMNLRDYMSWRQVDCHINNLYNTTFWTLIKLGGLDNREAEKLLAASPLPPLTHMQGTVSGDKNEILFSQFKINYNNEPEMYKKGSVVFRDYELVEPGTHNAAEAADALAEPEQQSKTQAEKDKKKRSKARVVIEHLDIIKDDFWDRRPWLLSNKPGKTPKEP
ncbi:tRNA(His) guanylyltransferase [Colletotrichum higginsianum IMI 349063]|uniref:tRNA(His) guanylyltransferase n=3 Tax=Colletotrichum higginsianum (strain IMI 349063) TaxID=759273 RepID=A0A1B7YDH8_COLHI|nr:tRNA(His) guanylyltransferase [Colletotrichum higginsianum IMI 349063]OBR10143.1 tRNA(His) guanylyltransferase [Colletotrichum higginsianum IMI 349063]